MDHRAPKQGFTLIEFLVIVVIVAILIGLLIPAVQGLVSSAPHNLHQQHEAVGLALHNYQGAHRHFPGSGRLTGSSKSQTVGGWSFLVMILP